MWMFLLSIALGWDELGPNGKPTGRTVDATKIFVPSQPVWSKKKVKTKVSELAYVARHTLRALRESTTASPALRSAGALEEVGVTYKDVQETLAFVVRIAEEDRGKRHQRLKDPAFLTKHFQAYRWYHDQPAAAQRGLRLTEQEIRLTKYLVFSVKGSPVQTPSFNTALYAIPVAEEQTGSTASRMKYTRMDVYAGVYEPGGAAAGQAKPLCWLTRDGVNQALMQGTIEVDIGDGTTRLFNVHKNNGRAYNPAIKDGNRQARFWYFREVKGISGVQGISLKAEAAVAGDIYNLGLGKVVTLDYGDTLRMVVVADTGGAFQPNLFQLDYLAGTFENTAKFKEGTAHLPTRTGASIMIRKK